VESQTDADRIRRSYAVLGLRAGAPLAEVRRRYRFLAQRWHPDRHAADSRNQAVANVEMRRINDAYQAIVERLATAKAPKGQVSQVERRLSADDIDRLASAIGSQGPVDWVLESLSWVGSAYEAVLLLVGGVAAVLLFVRALWHRDMSVFRQHPELILILGLIVLLVVREGLVRARVVQPGAREASERRGRRTRS